MAVSGGTALSIRDEWGAFHQLRSYIIAHFLPHSNINQSNPSKEVSSVWLLNWLQIDQFKEFQRSHEIKTHSNNNLERILDSPLVGYGGTKQWTMVRSAHTNSQKINLYGCSPFRPKGISVDEAYGYWQSKGMLRFGHWTVNNHHDCIGVNIIEDLRSNAMSLEGPIWAFIKSHFERLGPGYPSNEMFPSCDLLICVANEGVMYILDRLYSHYEWLRDQVVLLPLVQSKRKATRLRVGSLESLFLKEKIQDLKSRKNKEVSVLLFEIILTSSRTFLEIINVARSSGADHVFSVTLLDRSRIPNHIELSDIKESRVNSKLWRYDVDMLAPSNGLNLSAGCPICDGLEIAQRRLNGQLPINISNRVSQWIKAASLNNLYDSSPISGLQSEKLTAKVIGFGIDHSRTDKDKTEYMDNVTIRQTTALAAIIIEIMTITGRYDLVEKYLVELPMIEKEGEIDLFQIVKTKIELIVAQIVYMRSDTLYQRRLNLSKALLNSLYESPNENSATAFASIILFALESPITKGLILYLNELIGDKPKANLDFWLSVSFLLSRIGKIDWMETIEPKRKILLQSVLPLAQPLSSVFPLYIRDLLLILGAREGYDHKTLLSELLEDRTSVDISKSTVFSIIERLIN